MKDEVELLDDDAVDVIYAGFDTLLSRSAFAAVDEVLRAVDVTVLSPVKLLAFVSITNAPREHLAARSDFVARVRRHLMTVEPQRVEALLAGIE
jgi:hypothetical protein